MQEEIEQKTFNIMISTTKLSARTVLRAVKAAFRLYQSKASQAFGQKHLRKNMHRMAPAVPRTPIWTEAVVGSTMIARV